jgi:hypothetical protein
VNVIKIRLKSQYIYVCVNDVHRIFQPNIDKNVYIGHFLRICHFLRSEVAVGGKWAIDVLIVRWGATNRGRLLLVSI